MVWRPLELVLVLHALLVLILRIVEFDGLVVVEDGLILGRMLLLWLVVLNAGKLNSIAGHAIKVARPQPLFRLSYFDLTQVTIDPSLYSDAWHLLSEHLIDILLGLTLALVGQGIDSNLLEVVL